MILLKKTLVLLLFLCAKNMLFAQKKPSTEADFYGTWVGRIEAEKGKSFDIRYTFTSDKRGYTSFVYRDTIIQNVVYWRFDGTFLYETVIINGEDQEIYGKIEWDAEDQFTIQIVDNKNPAYKGVKRTFKRVPRV